MASSKTEASSRKPVGQSVSEARRVSRLRRHARLRKKIEGHLQAKHPDQWLPLYSQVKFTDTPYVDALREGQRHDRIMEEVLAMPGSKRITLTMLREVDSNELGKLFTRGVEDNTPKSEMGKLIPGLIKMGQIFSDQKKLAVGDTIMVEWVPGVGGVISAKGKPQGEPFKEPEFYNALLRIWLGPVPADYKLKEALLGRTI